jgi:biotin carboxyl carrier protein
MITIRRSVRIALVAAVLAPAPAYAQLDPLLFLKNTQPNVILAVDTANRMQRDADDTYYDPGTYSKDAYETTLGMPAGSVTKTYRRKYYNLLHSNINDANERFTASSIGGVPDSQATAYAAFFERTRLAIARRGLIQAVDDNLTNARFSLVRMRQYGSNIVTGNEQPVRITNNAAQQLTGDVSVNKWKITRNLVAGTNTSQTSSGFIATADNTALKLVLGRNVNDLASPKLVAAGIDTVAQRDAPLGLLLDDVRTKANELINTDIAAGGCRNTIVVLVAGGGEGTINPQDLKAKAATFKNVNGRRVPIYVVALFPSAGDVAALTDIATESGGQYFEVTKTMVESALSEATAAQPFPAVPQVVRAVNTAVQHAFAETTEFNTAPTVALPYGPRSEHQVTSPIVGTVNLRNATKLTAAGGTEVLPDSETYIFRGETEIPQRSNVLVTSGFTLPGFDAKLRAFRVYKPVADATQPSGYKFVQDGSRLWENSAPAAGSRNLYTVLPGSTELVPFTAANVDRIDDYLNVSDPAALIDYVRALPMGAILGSTPAFLDVPSLDPPPDASYPAFREANQDRRALIFIGANDGMLHALDARSGLEVWGFIPFNLLPKLKALRYGQSFDSFKYFVDSSPKIADVKVAGAWRTYLFFGQGPGGTFYNTLDVTLEHIADSVEEDSTNTASLLTYFANPEAITWEWSFPRLTSFDAEIASYGELNLATSSLIEQTIGETWSDPAIGQVFNETGPYVMVVGSGYLKYSVQSTYRTGVERSGTTFYVLDVANGAVLGNKDVGADANAETFNDCRTANDCRKMKNALQMDPVATGPQDQRFITMAYIGDLDGRVWKFNLGLAGASVTVSAPVKLYDAGAEYPLFASMATVNVGGANQYIFVGTGSDLLPSPDAANKPQTSSLLVLLDGGATATKKAEILLEKIDGLAGEEKVTTFPAVAGDIVFFTTTTYNANSATICATPYSASLYAFTFIGGPAYDTNNDGKLSSGTSGATGGKGGKKVADGTADSQKVFSVAGKRATAPFIVDQHLMFSTDGTIQMFGNPTDFNNGVGQAGVRILSWRAVK